MSSIVWGPELFVTIKAVIVNPIPDSSGRITPIGVTGVPHGKVENWALRCEQELINEYYISGQEPSPIDKTTTVVLSGSVSQNETPAKTPSYEELVTEVDNLEDVDSDEEIDLIPLIFSPKPRNSDRLMGTTQEERVTAAEEIVRPSTAPRLTRTISKTFSKEEIDRINFVAARLLSV